MAHQTADWRALLMAGLLVDWWAHRWVALKVVRMAEKKAEKTAPTWVAA